MIEVKEHSNVTYVEQTDWDENGELVVKKIPVTKEGGPETVKGCFTVYVIDKPVEGGAF